MTLPDSTVARLDALSGLIPRDVGSALADLAAAVPHDQAVVELGSFRGKSTAFLAAGAKAGHGAHVWAVDPWDLPGNVSGKHRFTDPEVRVVFEQQLRSVRCWSQVTAVRSFSTDAGAAWTGPPVGLLYVDGDHTHAAITADVAAWTPHLAPAHVLAFDDLDTPRNPGVRTAVEAIAAAGGYQLQVRAGRLAVLVR